MTAFKRRIVGSFLAWALVCAAAVPCMAATGDVITSFSSFTSGPFGMAWDGTNLWNGEDSEGGIYELTTAGTFVSRFAAPCTFTKGLTFDGTHLYTACDSTDLIYKLTKTGTIVSTIPTPGGTARGLTWDGTNFWIADAGTDRVYQITTAGTVLSSFATPSTDPRGLTWDGTSFWLADAFTDLVYQLTTTGTVLSSFSSPGGSPRGLTFDGTNFWHSDNGTDLIYQLEGRVPAYHPDAMIKLASEGAGGYLTDDLYEATASAQSKPLGVVSGSTAIYNVLFQNDGNVTDDLVITGTGSGSGFTVQYLDNTSTDRTGAVTGAGYTVGGLATGAGTMWTVNVTPSGAPTPVDGGTSYTVFVTAVSATDNTKIDQVKAVTTSTSANLTLLKIADKANAAPGEDITYIVNATNESGLTTADNVVVTDPVPANTGFLVGGATYNPGTSTLSFVVSYSNDNGSTWTYTPLSGECGAPAGYDDCVTDVKWTGTGGMPTGTAFSVGL
ncbi:MAG: hypothetical protein WBB46_06715, partial [Candidatus Deferrimicrobiaceae bacterium]